MEVAATNMMKNRLFSGLEQADGNSVGMAVSNDEIHNKVIEMIRQALAGMRCIFYNSNQEL